MHNNICRLCIIKVKKSALLDIAQIDNEICTKIQMHLNIDVKKNDMSSIFICSSCVRRVNKFHEYYQQVHDNQKKLFCIINQNELELPHNAATFETVTLETKNQILEYDEEEDISNKHQPANIRQTRTSMKISDKLKTERNKKEQNCLTNNTKEIKQGCKSEKPIIEIENIAAKEEIVNLNNSKSRTIENKLKQTKRNRKRKLSSPSIELKEHTDSKIELVTDNQIINYLEDNNDDDSIQDEPANENLSSKPFPEAVYKDGKFLIRNRELKKEMERFFLLTCNLCPAVDKTTADNPINALMFSTINSLFSHYKDIHGIKGYVSCCGKKISRKDMPHHFAVHVNPEEFKCKKCDYNTDKRLLLKLHEKKHVLDMDRKKFPCSMCNRTYMSAYYLKIHQAEVHPNNNQEMVKFQCKNCDISYYTQYSLQLHYIRAHAEKTLVCDSCGMKFRKNSDLTYHQFTHSTEKKYQCELCKKWFNSNHRLRIHSRRVHPLIKVEYKCDQCKYITFNAEKIKVHKRIRHTNFVFFNFL